MLKPTGTKSTVDSQNIFENEKQMRLAPNPPAQIAISLPRPLTPTRAARLAAPSKAPTPVAPIPPLRFAVPVHQLLFSCLPSFAVEPGNLLPTGMVITSYNKHRRLLSSPASFLVLNRKRRLRIEREPSLLSNQPLSPPLATGWEDEHRGLCPPSAKRKVGHLSTP